MSEAEVLKIIHSKRVKSCDLDQMVTSLVCDCINRIVTYMSLSVEHAVPCKYFKKLICKIEPTEINGKAKIYYSVE